MKEEVKEEEEGEEVASQPGHEKVRGLVARLERRRMRRETKGGRAGEVDAVTDIHMYNHY